MKEKKVPPPFIPDINESYFDNDYLTKHLSENTDQYINISALSKPTKVNLPRDQVYCGYSFYNPAEETCFFSPKKEETFDF